MKLFNWFKRKKKREGTNITFHNTAPHESLLSSHYYNPPKREESEDYEPASISVTPSELISAFSFLDTDTPTVNVDFGGGDFGGAGAGSSWGDDSPSTDSSSYDSGSSDNSSSSFD